MPEEEPAEAEEVFQYELLKVIKNISKTLEQINENLEQIRKKELEKIAETCRWVPLHPARTFSEALQSYWFTFLVGQLECGPMGNSSGRFDQYMYPFYKRDREKGRITEGERMR